MPLVFSATGTLVPPVPWPSNDGDGSISVTTPVGTAQLDIVKAIQTSTDLAAEVNSILGALVVGSGKDARTCLFALRDVVNRMVAGCDDLTGIRNFTP